MLGATRAAVENARGDARTDGRVLYEATGAQFGDNDVVATVQHPRLYYVRAYSP